MKNAFGFPKDRKLKKSKRYIIMVIFVLPCLYLLLEEGLEKRF